ncbi:MAG: DUF4920 domain-containing protein [Bdellovibrionales bacterium]|jgi:hypothetical protein|nr:DUF4920 domain-containing protein [Bdellovibrionales bacterium]
MKILILLCLISLSAMAANKQSFGKKISLSKEVKIEKIINNFDQYSGQQVLIRAKVEQVCKSKGCWMILKSKDLPSIRVTFENYSFFVPFNLEGKEVLVEGQLISKKMSVNEAKHYLEDAGKPQTEIDKIKKPIKEVRIIASAVQTIKQI